MTETEVHPLFHALSPAAALAAVQATPDGLSSEEVARRREVYGPNRLPEPPRRSPVLRFLAHFHNVLIYVLLASAAVTALLAHWVDTGVILAVVIVNAIIGFIQEGRAEQAMARRSMKRPAARKGSRLGASSTALRSSAKWATPASSSPKRICGCSARNSATSAVDNQPTACPPGLTRGCMRKNGTTRLWGLAN